MTDGLPDGWRVTALTELGTIDRGRSRHRPRYAEHLYGGSYPFIQTGDIKNAGGRVTSHEQTYSEAGLEQSRLWPAGTLCITIAANIAETAILTYPACFPDSVVGFIADESVCDVRFIEYSFRAMRSRIQHQASGSVQDNINLAVLRRLRFPVPPLAEQTRIADILGALDDKIELNRSMNRTLESIAHAIFKSWFVDFDPVRRKMKGSEAELPPDLAALFPHTMETTTTGTVPSGWRLGKCADSFAVTMGQSPPGNTYNEDGVGLAFYQGRRDFSERFPGRRVFCSTPTRFARRGDTLVSVRAPVGDINMSTEECCIGRGLAAVRHHSGAIMYTYEAMRALRLLFDDFEAGGTVFGSIGGKEFRNLPMVIPPLEVIQAYENVMCPIGAALDLADRNSRHLAVLRASLLPELIGGSVTMKS